MWNKVLVSVGGWPHKHIYKYTNDKYHLSPMSDGTFTVYRHGSDTPIKRDKLETVMEEFYIEDKKRDPDSMQEHLPHRG